MSDDAYACNVGESIAATISPMLKGIEFTDHGIAAFDAELRRRGLCIVHTEEIGRLRQTLHGIADADWRGWGEMASPDEYVQWAKSRARHALTLE